MLWGHVIKCISEYWKKGNIEPKGISWASLAGRCFASRWYSLLFNTHIFSIFSYTWFDTKSKPKFSTIWNFLIWFLLNSCHPFEVLKNYLVQQCNTIMPADILMFEGKKWKIAQIVSPQIPISSILPYSPKKSW